MNKKAIVTLVAALALAASASAQIRDGFGIIGGAGRSSYSYQGYKPVKQIEGQAGVAYKTTLSYGFYLQPELLYHYKAGGCKYILAETQVDKITNGVGYIEVPVTVGWGLDLGRNAVNFFVAPFAGVGVNCVTEYTTTTSHKLHHNGWKGDNLSRFEYGFNVGTGAEIGRFQLSAQLFWNLGSLCADSSKSNSTDPIQSMNGYMLKGNSYHGAEITLGWFF